MLWKKKMLFTLFDLENFLHYILLCILNFYGNFEIVEVSCACVAHVYPCDPWLTKNELKLN
jgi:hypothetical protein